MTTRRRLCWFACFGERGTMCCFLLILAKAALMIPYIFALRYWTKEPFLLGITTILKNFTSWFETRKGDIVESWLYAVKTIRPAT